MTHLLHDQRSMSESTPTASARDNVAQSRSMGIGRAKLMIGSVAFVLLTVGIFWYQFSFIRPAPRHRDGINFGGATSY